MKRHLLLVAVIAMSACTKQSETLSLDKRNDSGLRGIVNGEIATGTYRNVGALLIQGDFTCTATLISPSVVLTAAHCLATEDYGSVLPDITFTREIGSTKTARATDYRIHPDYFAKRFLTDLWDDYLYGINPEPYCETDPDTNEETCYSTYTYSGADLALIKLDERFDDFVAYNLGVDDRAVGEELTILGFGKDERQISGVKRRGTALNLGYFHSQIVNQDDLSEVGTEEGGYLITVPTAEEQLACFGDSGGPILSSVGGKPTIQGVLSLNLFDYEDMATPYDTIDTECKRVDGNAYISMDPYRSWIASKREELDPAGSCRSDSEQFGGLSGGCLQKSSGRIFSKVITSSPSSVQSNRLSRASAASACDDLVEGGFSDWELPTATDLMEAAKDGAFDTFNLGDPRYYWYWSSTPSGLSTDTGTAVRLSDGLAKVGYPLHLNYNLSVLCVRPGG